MKRYTRGGYALPGTALAFKTGSWRVQRPQHVHTQAPCSGACPAGENPQAYIAHLDAGQPRAAWETLVEANPLPAITGRVCHHPCEQDCNRGAFDEAIGIHSIERFLGDEAIAHGWHYPVVPPPADAPRVAVVGAGPAGLSAAYHLIRLGCRPTLFTALSEAGGTLHSIPRYRLPAEVVQTETARLLAAGIDFRPGHRLGRDMHLPELQAEFSAVFLGLGTQTGKEWSVGGVVPGDLHDGLGLLKAWRDTHSVPTPASAAVVGGGNTAIDVARVLRRAGVREVHLITHQGLPGGDTPPADAMEAFPREIAQAEEEGVIIHAHRGIRRLLLRGERVVGVELVHMKALLTAGGRLERVAFEGTETVLHVDQVIPAIGHVVNPAGVAPLLNGQAFLPVDAWGRVGGQPDLYAGGDACGAGRGSVTAAVGDGRRAAAAIAATLAGQELTRQTAVDSLGPEALNLNYYAPAPRAQPTILPVEQRLGEEEIEGGLAAAQVATEARRCFSCGNCLACDNCWTLCPDSAVLKTRDVAADGSHYVFDYDYCKGCGLCANECPCGFITMVADP